MTNPIAIRLPRTLPEVTPDDPTTPIDESLNGQSWAITSWRPPFHREGVTPDPADYIVQERDLIVDTERQILRFGNGADYGGVPVATPFYIEEAPSIPNPVNLRTILTDRQVTRMLSGAGDGDTSAPARAAETLKFQNIANQGKSFSVPEPNTTYAVNTINLALGQTVQGCGQWQNAAVLYGGRFQFTGNGVDPVFAMGNGSGNPRHQTLMDLSAFNDGADVVFVDNAPNCLLQRIRLRTPGNACAVRARYAYRFAIRDSWIAGNDAIRCLDNINGLEIDHCTITGGSGGRAMQIGQSQAVRLTNNIIESSLEGVWIASTSDSGDGLCSGLTIADNYIEQSKTPFKLGTVFTVQGLDMSGNYISNASVAIISAREASIQFGRIRGGSIQDNAIYPHATEDVFRLQMDVVTGDFEDLSVVRNRVNGTPANTFQLMGTYAANASVKAVIGGQCHFDFMGSGDPIGTPHVNEWVSPVIDAAAGQPSSIWLQNSRKTLGGRIKSIDVIDHNGGTHAGTLIAIGRTGAATETVASTNMSSLTFSGGIAPLTVASTAVLDGFESLYQVTGAASQTAKFRIRIRYRAN